MDTGELVKKIKAAEKSGGHKAVNRLCWERLRDEAEACSGSGYGRITTDLLRMVKELMDL